MPHAALPGTANDLNSPAENRLRGAHLHKDKRSGITSVMAPHPALGTNVEVACMFPFAGGVMDADLGVPSDYRIMRERLRAWTVVDGSAGTMVNRGGVDVRN